VPAGSRAAAAELRDQCRQAGGPGPAAKEASDVGHGARGTRGLVRIRDLVQENAARIHPEYAPDDPAS
jgi:hypothetical protein